MRHFILCAVPRFCFLFLSACGKTTDDLASVQDGSLLLTELCKG
jgi:hypothetical protein